MRDIHFKTDFIRLYIKNAIKKYCGQLQSYVDMYAREARGTDMIYDIIFSRTECLFVVEIRSFLGRTA